MDIPIWIKYFLVFLLSGLKFFIGPLYALTMGLNLLIACVLAALGMITVVFVISYFEKYIHAATKWLLNISAKKRKFTPLNRQFVKIWRKFGLLGLAFLTPILFTPIVGAILANAVGGEKRKIVQSMSISAVFWSLVAFILMTYARNWAEAWL